MGCAWEAQYRGFILGSSSKFRWPWESCLIAAFVSAPALCCLFSWLVSLTEHYGKLIFGHQSIILMQLKKRIFFSSLVAEHWPWKTLASFVFPVLFFEILIFLLWGFFSLFWRRKHLLYANNVILPAVGVREEKRKSEVGLVSLISKEIFFLNWRKMEFFILYQIWCLWCVKKVSPAVCKANGLDVCKKVLTSLSKGKLSVQNRPRSYLLLCGRAELA